MKLNDPPPLTQNAPGPLVIALGSFGQNVCDTILHCKANDPTRSIPPVLWAGPLGWSEHPDATPPRTPAILWLPVPDWLEKYQAAGAIAFRNWITSVASSARANTPTSVPETGTAVVCIAHLQEAFGRNLLLPTLQMIEHAQPPFGRLSVTLILAVNSFRLVDNNNEGNLVIRETLDALSHRSNQPGTPIDWLYLVDTLDHQSHLLSPLAWEDNHTVDAELIQQHSVAEFILSMADGLFHSAAYQNTRRETQPAASSSVTPMRVGTFASGRLIFPAVERHPAAANRLARAILRDWMIGSERPRDIPQVNELHRAWSEDCQLEYTAMLHQITRDADGQRLVYAMRPPDLSKVPPGELVGYLQYWDSVLEKRWQDTQSYRAILLGNANQQISNAKAWLDLRLNDLIQRQPGGARLAVMFLTKAAKALEIERQNTPPPKTTPRGWHTKTASFWQWAGKHVLGLPDAGNLQSCLAALNQAAGARVAFQDKLHNLWQMGWKAAPRQAGLALAAILFVGLIVGPAILATSLPLLGVLVLVFLSARWGRHLTRNVFLAVRNEIRLHDALEKTVQAIRSKYHQRIEQAASDESGRVYSEVTACLAEWQRWVDQRAATLKQTGELLDTPDADMNEPPLWLEHEVTPVGARSNRDEELNATQIKEIVEQFLRSDPRTGWREQSAPDLAAALRSFCEQAALGRIQPLEFQLRIERAAQQQFPNSPQGNPAASWLNWLFERLRPPLPLLANGALPYGIHPNAMPGGIWLRFAGMPRGTLPRRLPQTPGEPPVELFECSPTNHLIGIVLIQGIDLKQQPLWKMICQTSAIRAVGEAA